MGESGKTGLARKDRLRSIERSGYYYDFPEYSVLATRLENLFVDRNLCKQFSDYVQQDAQRRHDRAKNIMCLKNIYKTVIEEETKDA